MCLRGGLDRCGIVAFYEAKPYLYFLKVQMKKSFSLFLAVMFLAVQMLSIVHMAEHGFLEHKHDGHKCDIELYCQLAKIPVSPPPVMDLVISFFLIAMVPVAISVYRSQRYNSATARAPPFILHP